MLPQDAHVHKTESAPPSPHPLSSSSDDPLLRPGAHTGVNGPNWLMSTLPAAVDNIVRVLNANGVFAHTDGSHSTQARTQPPTPAKQQIQQKNSQKVDSADIDSDDGLDDVGDNASAHVNNDKPQYEDPLRFFMSGGSNSSTSAALNKGKDAHVAVESKPSSAVAKQNPKESQINTHVFAGSGKATTPPGKRFGIFNRQRIKDRSTGGAESSAETQTKISQHILDIAATLQTHAISTANLKNTTTAPVTTATITAAIDESTQQLTTSSTANSISSSVSCPDTLILEVIGKLRGLAHVLNGHTTLDLFESFYASGHSTVNPEAVVDTCMLADGSSNSDRASVSDGAEATLTLKDPQSSVPSVQTVKVEPDPLSMQIPLRVAASHVTEEQKY